MGNRNHLAGPKRKHILSCPSLEIAIGGEPFKQTMTTEQLGNTLSRFTQQQMTGVD